MLEPISTFVLVPFAVATIVTGMLDGVAAPWGLARHYWVAIKLWVSVAAVKVLLIHTCSIATMAAAGRNGSIPDSLSGVRLQLVVASAGGAIVLILMTALSIYEPRGMTRCGLRFAARASSSPQR